MSPAAPLVAAQLRQAIYYSLDNDLHANAAFFAGRLHGQDPRGPDSAHLLALCHYRAGRLRAAYDAARDRGLRGQHLGCAFVFAQASLGLELPADGIAGLERARGLWGGRNHWNRHSETQRRHLPDAAAVNYLLGKLWRAHGDLKKALDCYVEALKINPLLWDAFVDLADIGAAVRTTNIFKLTPEMQAYYSHSMANLHAADGSPLHASMQVPRSNPIVTTPGNDPFTTSSSRVGGEVGLNMGGSNLLSRLNGLVPSVNASKGTYFDAETPTANGARYDDDVMMGDAGGNHPGVSEPPHAPPRKPMAVQPFAADATGEPPKMKPIMTRSRLKLGSDDSSGSTEIPRPAATHAHKRTISGHAPPPSAAGAADPSGQPQRKSERLIKQFSQMRPTSTRMTATSAAAAARDLDAKDRQLRKAAATGTKGRTKTSMVGRIVSGNRKPMEHTDQNIKDSRPASVAPTAVQPVTKSAAAATAPQPSQAAQELEALQWILDLLAKLGNGYFCLSRYQCQAALQAFMAVPSAQRETPWVLAQIGKAYYEKSSYAEAEEVFAKIKKICPSRMEDMEVYSTVLWHLRKETDLAYLSHELVEADRLSPEAWCAIGNSFSLQREHDQAIKCFRRATQLNPKFAYAFTLQGHEHSANEENDKALLAYRCAISAEHRHYNGWYGLGRVYERMGKFDVAEKHYKCAAQINPTNAVLVVRIGVVLERMRRPQAALVQYAHACVLDPRSALSRFKKAHVLMKLRRPREALAELEVLKDLAPDEANVHFMLGRLYKMMGDKTGAVRHYTIAMNLDPKAAQYIKEAMESLDDEDDDGFDDDDVS